MKIGRQTDRLTFGDFQTRTTAADGSVTVYRTKERQLDDTQIHILYVINVKPGRSIFDGKTTERRKISGFILHWHDGWLMK